MAPACPDRCLDHTHEGTAQAAPRPDPVGNVRAPHQLVMVSDGLAVEPCYSIVSEE